MKSRYVSAVLIKSKDVCLRSNEISFGSEIKENGTQHASRRDSVNVVHTNLVKNGFTLPIMTFNMICTAYF